MPATQGGAVEELIDHYVALNAVSREHDFTVFTCAPSTRTSTGSLSAGFPTGESTPTTTYVTIPMHSLRARLRRKLRAHLCPPRIYDYYVNDFYLSARRRLLRQRWDAVILENRPGFALDLRQHTAAHIILHHHLDNLGPDMPHSAEMCRNIDLVISASDYLANRVHNIIGDFPADKRPHVTTVHNGIDVKAFASAKPANRADFGLAPTDFVIVYSGRIDPIKGIRELVKAMCLINSCGTATAPSARLRLLIVGGSFYGGDIGGNQDFLLALRAEAAPLRDNIVFTGFVPHGQVASLLKMADLAVLPSTCQEAFALTVVEAMAAGVPVLTTRSGGVPETCEGVAHILDQGPDLPQRLADEIVQLASAPDELRRMAEAGRQRAQQFSHKAYARAFLDALQSPP